MLGDDCPEVGDADCETCARVLAQAQHNTHEKTVYFMVTNQTGEAKTVWQFYNGRGECENRIAELKNGFHADRLSCHRFLANAFRLVLHSLAYNLVNLFRQQLPEALRTLQISSLRTRLFKVGAQIVQTTRWVWVHLASAWPYQGNFRGAAQACG